MESNRPMRGDDDGGDQIHGKDAASVSSALSSTVARLPSNQAIVVPILLDEEKRPLEPCRIVGSSSSSTVARPPSNQAIVASLALMIRSIALLSRITVNKLAEKHHGLNSLKSSDLSENSWFAVSWSPSIQIPELQVVKGYFLTYHSFTPVFPEKFPQEAKVELPAFGVVGSELSDKVWIMPGTSDQENMYSHEESAASWLGKTMFSHTGFDMFMVGKKTNDLPVSSGVVTGK